MCVPICTTLLTPMVLASIALHFDIFRWFCHVDDDTYVNVPELSRLLRKYNHTEDWYLGKPSLKHPLEMNDPEHKGVGTRIDHAINICHKF
jgi:hypothetical protein